MINLCCLPSGVNVDTHQITHLDIFFSFMIFHLGSILYKNFNFVKVILLLYKKYRDNLLTKKLVS